ncbi:MULTISPECIES: MBL fold metallo-hydrolase [unclassified Eubacterium (in: firmicutes)]|jgi:competence protein ComEC|uniref:ComEC/Rec2 family competence protein n=1 Tax=unclassified Eubacterium (in: firmicutes) TaxID=2624479 RepID=UPI00033FCB21|nr:MULTISPECIES: MBL fold metallo-hydrolase [unclassified Eubacterium (in: firmicutes)]RGG63663.1 MBL fold metallo-hydrolase [Eubacterium sp. AF17-7]RHR34736.1 MBL fold metallo-hydrolase [Eubacterium sp. AF19-12LB]CDA29717.1 predicted hydrolase (Metallo-beta-lactamase superfamily) [Eubacterium sp. CAG:156]
MKKVIRLLICIAMTIILTVGCEDKDIDNTNFNNENQSVNYDIDVTSNNLTNENKVERSTDEFDSISSIKGECNVWVLDVGQGSSTLVESDGEYMLIDGGDSDKSSYLVSYLKKKEITNFKYVIATHYDADHLNGVVGALNVFDVENVICPEYTTTTRVYNSFISIMDNKKINRIQPIVGETYSLGRGEFTIIAPNSTGYSNVNDYSVGIRFKYNNKSFLVAGDATNISEEEIVNNSIDINSDVYIVNHHGSSGSSSSEFLNKIDPEYAVISAGKGNAYGHPAYKTLEKLNKIGAKIYRTDIEGEIEFSFTEKEIQFNKDSYNKLESGEKINKDSYENNQDNKLISSNEGDNRSIENESSNKSDNYVLNKNTKKIHKDDCKSVKQMSDNNKVYFDGTIDEAEAQGYSKCQNCFKNE